MRKNGKSISATCRQVLEDNSTYTGVASVAIIVVIWALAARPGTSLAGVLPPPQDLLKAFWGLILHGYQGTSLWTHFQASLLRTMAGFITGSAAGVLLGLLMGYDKVVSAALAPFFSFIRPIPAIAYIPMVILWFGIGEFSKIVVIFLSSFLYVSLNTSAGVKAVPGDLVRVAQTFGASGRQLFTYVIFPECLPYIFLGLKVGLALSWAVVVASELVAAQSGLGYMIMDAATFFRIKDVYIGVFLIGLVGLLLEWLLGLLERSFVHWSGK